MRVPELVDQLAQEVERAELWAIEQVDLVRRLRRLCESAEGIKIFATLFHPIRYSFVHVNFIVGSRQEMHEIMWAGLARNLYEELGGGVTAPHNEIYRHFLRSIGISSDQGIEEVQFSKKFNESWRSFARSAPIEDAVLAIAVYEILDRPDYGSLFNALKDIDHTWRLEFFRIHSVVEHFDMFSEFVAWYFDNVPDAKARFDKVKDFVLREQYDMWVGLLANMERAAAGKRSAFAMKSTEVILQ